MHYSYECHIRVCCSSFDNSVKADRVFLYLFAFGKPTTVVLHPFGRPLRFTAGGS